MPTEILRTFLSILEEVGASLTQPSYANFVILAVGWIQTYGTHAVTQSLVVTGVAGKRHHEAFHRFFSRGTWKPDDLGRRLFHRLERWTGTGAVRICIDDTLASKKGPHVFGIGSHIDAVQSTKRRKVFCFGHCWVVLAVLVDVPFSSRVWALPVLFRLYRNKKECAAHDGDYSKKTELAREMVEVFLRWTDRRIELAADSGYCNDTVTRGLTGRVVLFGAMRPDAVLTALPRSTRSGPRGGRPRKVGDALPKPVQIAQDGTRPWQTCEVFIYGRKMNVRYKTICAQWYRACGTRLLRIVIVATDTGAIPLRVFFCTDASLGVPQILAGYGARWAIECFFREAKQLLGFADSSARKENAVLRTAPFVGLLYTALVVWFIEGASTSPLATPPVRPWYGHKSGLSFEDILRTARRTLVHLDVLVPCRNIANLHQLPMRLQEMRRPMQGRLLPEGRNLSPSPARHQVFDFPKIEPTFDEYRQHALGCECGHVTRAPLPPNVPRGAFGPGVVAVVAVLMGVYRLSKRMASSLMLDLFGLRMSLGAVIGCQQMASEAIATPVDEAKTYIVEQPVKHADETSWREGVRRSRAWLWAVTTSKVVVFMVHARRNTDAARALLVRAAGVLVSDRHGAYLWWPDRFRQLCWAHIRRDLQAIIDRGGQSAVIGRGMLEESDRMFHWWHRVRDGTLSRASFQVYMRSLRPRFEAGLELGTLGDDPKTAKTCANLLKHAAALWTFVRVDGVEPTNNSAEQVVRHGVIIRKISHGTHSEAGSRFIERILSVHASLRRQDRNVLQYLRDACAAKLNRHAPPSLLPIATMTASRAQLARAA